MDDDTLSPRLSRRLWISATIQPKQVGVRYEVLMPDGSINEALWTGSRWYHGREISPDSWRIQKKILDDLLTSETASVA